VKQFDLAKKEKLETKNEEITTPSIELNPAPVVALA